MQDKKKGQTKRIGMKDEEEQEQIMTTINKDIRTRRRKQEETQGATIIIIRRKRSRGNHESDEETWETSRGQRQEELEEYDLWATMNKNNIENSEFETRAVMLYENVIKLL